jgi:hypothetical protein
MNEPLQPDPELQAMEASMAASVPLASAETQRRLLYQCAFAAGRVAAERSLRRWQIGSVGIGVLLAGWLLTTSGERGERVAGTIAPLPVASAPDETEVDSPLTSGGARPTTAVALDAWKMTAADRPSLASELAQFRETDPHFQALAAGNLGRTLLTP